MTLTEVLSVAQRLAAIAQAGLAFEPSGYDRERYEEVRELAASLLQGLTGAPRADISRALAFEAGYPTPKVDVRVVLFN